MSKILGKIKKLFNTKKQNGTEERLPMEVKKEAVPVATNVLEIFCPYCASANFVKRGTRQKTRESYICAATANGLLPRARSRASIIPKP